MFWFSNDTFSINLTNSFLPLFLQSLLKIISVFLVGFLYPASFAQTYNEIKVHCVGEGSSIYLIGGGPAFATWNLQPIQNQLKKDFKVCRWDMRGVGDNAGLSLNPETSVLDQWIIDMDKVLPQQPVILWGHSWGALQAMLFAKKYPNRVSKLILSNPVDPALLSMENIERKLINHPDIDSKLTLEDIETPAEKRHVFRSKIASYFLNGEQGWVYSSQFSPQDSNNHLNLKVWDEYKKKPLTDSDVKRLRDKVAGLIHCHEDVLQPESLAEYRRLLVSNKHHLVTGCAHFPWEEKPKEYYQVLSDLIERDL